MAQEKKIELGVLGKSRLENLTDGIFAFAMTLLVLGIEVPDLMPAAIATSGNPVQMILASLYPDFTHYVLAFVMLAAFWVIHHSFFEHVRFIDRRMLWLNLFALMFVALMPFSTSLADTYVEYPVSAMVFEVNVLIVGLLFYAQWAQASEKHRLVREDIPEKTVSHLKHTILVMPAISLVALLAAFMGMTWSITTYAVTPVVYTIWPMFAKR